MRESNPYPHLTDEEFYELCAYKDYAVGQLVAHNPERPEGWRTLVEIMDGQPFIKSVSES